MSTLNKPSAPYPPGPGSIYNPSHQVLHFYFLHSILDFYYANESTHKESGLRGVTFF